MGKGFTKDAKRIDPYKNFKFRVSWDGKTVLGVSKVGALKRTTEVVKHRDGGDNSHDSKSPGRTSYDAITMERGITHDAEFEAWANKIHSWAGDSAMDLANFKKELTLEIMNEKNQVAFRYFLHDCWVSEFTSVPELNANANAVAIESIKIEINGWERDTDTKEPDPNG
ncbi:MAG: phage tail protein [Bacteroidetes bacterium]|nr:phage tail protein [Bacteroidota bacterium]